MSCDNCVPTVNITYDTPYSKVDNCASTDTTTNDAAKIIYNGAALPCSGVATATDLQTVLQTFDTKLCAVLGDYSTYNTYCLAPITTQKEFVEAISNAYCNLQSAYDTFTGTTYIGDKNGIDALIAANNTPNTTSTNTAVFDPVSTDTVAEVLQKVSNSICAVYSTALDMSGVTWGTCYTVGTTPTTVQEGFSTVISQICTLKTTVDSLLPVFDNTGSCITGGGTTDNLITTIGLIKTQLCKATTLDTTALTFTCVTKPVTVTLQSTLQALLTSIDTLSGKIPVFDTTDFTTVPGGCSGTSVSIADGLITDNKVAATSSDSNPGALEDKLAAGTNVTIDYTTNAGKATISATTGTANDEKVKAFSADTTAGYLYDKVSGTDSGDVIINITEDTTNNQVNIAAVVDATSLLTTLLNELDSLDPASDLFQLFCAIKNKCPDSCSEPTDVSVNYYSGSDTNTSTSTTTTTTV